MVQSGSVTEWKIDCDTVVRCHRLIVVAGQSTTTPTICDLLAVKRHNQVRLHVEDRKMNIPRQYSVLFE